MGGGGVFYGSRLGRRWYLGALIPTADRKRIYGCGTVWKWSLCAVRPNLERKRIYGFGAARKFIYGRSALLPSGGIYGCGMG